MSDLQVVLRITRGVGANKQAMSRVGLIGDTSGRQDLVGKGGRGCAYSCLSGSHCVVRVGHSYAVLRIMS